MHAVLVAVALINEIGWPHGYVSGPLPNSQHQDAKSGAWKSPLLSRPFRLQGSHSHPPPAEPSMLASSAPCWDLMMVCTAGSNALFWRLAAPG